MKISTKRIFDGSKDLRHRAMDVLYILTNPFRGGQEGGREDRREGGRTEGRERGRDD